MDTDMDMDILGVWQHITLQNIDMDTDMDMDIAYGSTLSF